MTSFVALLRGINVGGNKAIPMAELRGLLESLGLVDVKSLLQSGNLVFSSKSPDARSIVDLLEKATEKRFGHRIAFVVRSAKEWKVLVKRNPFHDEAARDPGHLLVLCLKDEPKPNTLAALKAAISGRECFQACERQLYVFYPDGVGRSKLTHAVIEGKLGIRGTARNWNTVMKIAALLTAG